MSPPIYRRQEYFSFFIKRFSFNLLRINIISIGLLPYTWRMSAKQDVRSCQLGFVFSSSGLSVVFFFQVFQLCVPFYVCVHLFIFWRKIFCKWKTPLNSEECLESCWQSRRFSYLWYGCHSYVQRTVLTPETQTNSPNLKLTTKNE